MNQQLQMWHCIVCNSLFVSPEKELACPTCGKTGWGAIHLKDDTCEKVIARQDSDATGYKS